MKTLVPPFPFQVAIASNDGRTINACFGRARAFRIYAFNQGGFRLSEIRSSPTPCQGGSHEDGVLTATVEALADCQMVLAGRIGPEAGRLLREKGVEPFSLHAGIESTLRRLMKLGQTQKMGDTK